MSEINKKLEALKQLYGRNLYYQPNEVVFREGNHGHDGDDYPTEFDENGQIIEKKSVTLQNFIQSTGDLPDKNDHHLYFVDTSVQTNRSKNDNSSSAKNTEIVVLFKGKKPVSVDYRYIANAPKVTVNESNDLQFDMLLSKYSWQSNDGE